ncbi:MAG: DUF2379 family protein, partial [Gemmatimonadota bacterium]
MQRALLAVTALLMLLSLFHCQKMPESAEDVKSEKDVASLLERLEKRYEESCIRMGRANWNLYSGEDPGDLNAIRAEFSDILLDSLYRKIISDWRYMPPADVDPRLKRRLEIWTQCFLGAYVEEDEDIYTLEHLLEERNHLFRFSLNGVETSQTELNRIIRMESDPEKRRRAWEAFSQLSEANEKDLRRLFRTRNEKLEPLGRKMDYGIFSLMVQSINASWLERIMIELEEQTREPYRQFVDSMKSALDLETLYPWDIQYALRQSASLPDEFFPRDQALPTLFEFLNAIGFQTKELPIHITEGEYHYDVFGLAVEIPKNVKLLVGQGR